MITRKEFVKGCAVACAASFCASAHAEGQTAGAGEACDAEKLKAASWRAQTAPERFAGLVEVMERELSPEERKRLLNGMGRACARTFGPSLIDRYRGNLRGFLDEAQGPHGWMREAKWDEAAGVLEIHDRSEHCTCPLVKEGTTPAAFCDCTLGWQQEAYSRILGKPVNVELIESILRGGKRCSFRIQVV